MGTSVAPIHLPLAPIIPHKRPCHSAWAFPLAIPPNGDCLCLLWAVHLSSNEGHAKRVLAMATFNPNCASSKRPNAPPHHHPPLKMLSTLPINDQLATLSTHLHWCLVEVPLPPQLDSLQAISTLNKVQSSLLVKYQCGQPSIQMQAYHVNVPHV